MDEDEPQFGPWLSTIARKVNKKKGNVNQTNPSVDDDYEIQAPERIGGPINSSQVRQQQADVQLIGKAGRTVRLQLTEHKENPVEREFSNSSDPMLNSNSEGVSILSLPTLAENQAPLSDMNKIFISDNSKLISPDIPKDHVVSYFDKSSLNLEESI